MTTISVVIPCFNSGRWLASAIDSVLEQGLPDVEIIVVNDGSTDDTQEVAEKYFDKIVIVNQENSGVSSARRVGVRHARGDYIKFLDSDDRLSLGSLALFLEIANNFPGEALIGKAVAISDFDNIFNEDAYGLPCKFSHLELLPREFLLTQATQFGMWFLPRGVVNCDKFYNRDINLGEEYTFCIEVIKSGVVVRYCDEIVCKVRVHNSPERLSRTKNELDHLKQAGLILEAANFIRDEMEGASSKSLLYISKLCWVRARDCLRIDCPIAADAYLRVAKDVYPDIRPVGSFVYRFLCRFLGPGITEAFLLRVKWLFIKARRV